MKLGSWKNIVKFMFLKQIFVKKSPFRGVFGAQKYSAKNLKIEIYKPLKTYFKKSSSSLEKLSSILKKIHEKYF